MHIALSYTYNSTYHNDYLENDLRAFGDTITFIGPPADHKAGYNPRVPLSQLFSAWPQPPDLYLAIDPSDRYFPPGIEDLPVPTACWLGDVHLGHWREDVAQFFDIVFVPHKDYVARYRQVVGHDQVYWLPLYVPDHVRPIPDLPRVYDVGFVGNVVHAHRRTPRSRRLELLSSSFHMNEQRSSVTHEELSRIYSQSRIIVNTTINGDVNLRLFEGTACGALMLTDSDANGLSELFDVGREMIVYGDDADLLAMVRYYLAHEDERISIALAGQRRCLHDHTYTRRVEQLLRYLAGPIDMRAPMRVAGTQERCALRRRIYTHLHTLDPILDEAHAEGFTPLKRAWAVAPALIRRLLI